MERGNNIIFEVVDAEVSAEIVDSFPATDDPFEGFGSGGDESRGFGNHDRGDDGNYRDNGSDDYGVGDDSGSFLMGRFDPEVFIEEIVQVFYEWTQSEGEKNRKTND